MPGLAIPIGGGASLGNASRQGLGQTGGATIAQTAYGLGSTVDSGTRGAVEHWQAFISVQVAALAWLVFLRWSLPSGKKGA
jgi:hypothetical protein